MADWYDSRDIPFDPPLLELVEALVLLFATAGIMLEGSFPPLFFFLFPPSFLAQGEILTFLLCFFLRRSSESVTVSPDFRLPAEFHRGLPLTFRSPLH